MLKFPKLKRSLALTLALLLSFSLFGCTTEELETAGEIIGTVADIADAVTQEEGTEGDQIAEDPEEEMTELPVEDSDLPAEPEQEPEQEEPAIDYDGVYTGGLDDYAQDMCIGGDTFGNREGLLPKKYKYIECDIDTLNEDSRGAKRIVFSKGLEVIYYTPDHYESFELLYGEE